MAETHPFSSVVSTLYTAEGKSLLTALSSQFSCTEGDEWSPELRPAGATYFSVWEKKHKVTQMLVSKEFKGSWKGRRLVTRYISACASNMPDPRKKLKKENRQGR